MAYHCYGMCDPYTTPLHCADFNFSQCTGCNRYQNNDGPDYKPHYPVPAIVIEIDYIPFKGLGVAIYLTETTEGIDNGRYWIYHNALIAWDKNGRY